MELSHCSLNRNPRGPKTLPRIKKEPPFCRVPSRVHFREHFRETGKRKTYTGTSRPLFSKKAMQWGKKWPVQMNLPFFAVEAYVPGGVQNQAEKNSKKCLLACTGTKVYFSSERVRGTNFAVRMLCAFPTRCTIHNKKKQILYEDELLGASLLAFAPHLSGGKSKISSPSDPNKCPKHSLNTRHVFRGHSETMQPNRCVCAPFLPLKISVISKPTTEFARARLSRSNGGHP